MKFGAYGRALMISPKKVLKLSRFLKGYSYSHAMSVLRELNSKSARVLEKLLKSAFYNGLSKKKDLDEEQVKIDFIRVNQGMRYKRVSPRAQGRAYVLRKPTSHVFINLIVSEED